MKRWSTVRDGLAGIIWDYCVENVLQPLCIVLGSHSVDARFGVLKRTARVVVPSQLKPNSNKTEINSVLLQPSHTWIKTLKQKRWHSCETSYPFQIYSVWHVDSASYQWHRNEFKSGGTRPKKFFVEPLHFLTIQVQLVILVSAFVMVSTVLSVSCLPCLLTVPPVPRHL